MCRIKFMRFCLFPSAYQNYSCLEILGAIQKMCNHYREGGVGPQPIRRLSTQKPPGFRNPLRWIVILSGGSFAILRGKAITTNWSSRAFVYQKAARPPPPRYPMRPTFTILNYNEEVYQQRRKIFGGLFIESRRILICRGNPSGGSFTGFRNHFFRSRRVILCGATFVI